MAIRCSYCNCIAECDTGHSSGAGGFANPPESHPAGPKRRRQASSFELGVLTLSVPFDDELPNRQNTEHQIELMEATEVLHGWPECASYRQANFHEQETAGTAFNYWWSNVSAAIPGRIYLGPGFLSPRDLSEIFCIDRLRRRA